MQQRAIELIAELIGMEGDVDAKFNMLTSISIDTTNNDIFRASEEVRNNLPTMESPTREEILTEVLRDKTRSRKVNSSEFEKGSNDDTGEAGNTTIEFTAFCLYVLTCSILAIWLGWNGYV